jgi:hypothetical protein
MSKKKEKSLFERFFSFDKRKAESIEIYKVLFTSQMSIEKAKYQIKKCKVLDLKVALIKEANSCVSVLITLKETDDRYEYANKRLSKILKQLKNCP